MVVWHICVKCGELFTNFQEYLTHVKYCKGHE